MPLSDQQMAEREARRQRNERTFPYPIKTWYFEHPVPDLSQISRDEWEDALRRSHPTARRMAWDNGRLSPQEFEDAMDLAMIIELEPPKPRVVPEPELPEAAQVVVPRRRQVAFRLSPREFEELQEVADANGLTPAGLARLLTLRGVALAKDGG